MERTPKITMDSDAGLALLWLAVRGVPMHYTELASRMWPDNRNIRIQVEFGLDTGHRLRAAFTRREAWATQDVNRLILAGLAEVDPDKGEGWARVTIAGAELAKAWGVGS